MQNNYKAQFSRYYDLVNGYLISFFEKLNKSAPKTITDAMEYSVMNGGKRIRPIMCLATADMLGVPLERVERYCVAIECIQSYSLVHDDLPAMDNDDYRRGKLSTHKKFGEANGILAGDALLNVAFEYCLSKEDFDNYDAKALYQLASASGYSGMIAGQVLDLENENNSQPDEKTLYNIYENKTAKLITAPLMIACELSGGKFRQELYEYGKNLGLTFQMIDDVLDVEGSLETLGKTPHKDEQEDKLTSIKVFGLEGAKARAEVHYKKCLDAIKELPNNQFFIELASKMFNRKS